MIYFLFYETRHYGHAFEFVDKKIAVDLACNQDNMDMLPCKVFIPNGVNSVYVRPLNEDNNLACYKVNNITALEKKTDEFFIEIKRNQQETIFF